MVCGMQALQHKRRAARALLLRGVALLVSSLQVRCVWQQFTNSAQVLEARVASSHLQAAFGVGEQVNHIGRGDDFISGGQIIGCHAVVRHARAAQSHAPAQFQIGGQQFGCRLERMADINAVGSMGFAQFYSISHQDDECAVAFAQRVDGHGQGHSNLAWVAVGFKEGGDEVGGLHGFRIKGVKTKQERPKERGWACVPSSIVANAANDVANAVGSICLLVLALIGQQPWRPRTAF